MSLMTALTENPPMWRPEDTLAARLLLVRAQLGLTQRQAAERTGVTFGEWQGMEAGRSPRGLDAKVHMISTELGVDRDWLMWGGPLRSSDAFRGGTGGGLRKGRTLTILHGVSNTNFGKDLQPAA